MIPRKYALKKAIDFLSTQEGFEDVVKTLQDIREDLPLVRWEDKTIHDSISNFMIEHGRMPTTEDFKHDRSLPPHPVIKNIYGVCLTDWLAVTYGIEKYSYEELKERHSKAFIEEYHRIKACSAKDYESRKTPWTTPAWQNLRKYYNVDTWNELLKALNLPKYYNPNRKNNGRKVLSVKISTDIDDQLHKNKH